MIEIKIIELNIQTYINIHIYINVYIKAIKDICEVQKRVERIEETVKESNVKRSEIK